jgi:hypothetical protein
MLGLIDRWFEPVRPSQRYLRQDYILLFLILLIGTWLRFWHLGNVGLHGDEDIMGLAARGVITHGIPILPSGMVYSRAPLHTYLLAGSTLLFGDNEWSLRLPSAVAGSLCGLLAFFMGRRFLDAKPNIAFVTLITFLPAMIEVSQTARMYVFFVASLLAFGTLLFRWERTGTTISLLLTFLSLLLAFQFHALSVFASPLLLFPGLANRSRKQLCQGTVAFALAVVTAELFSRITERSYPENAEQLILETEDGTAPLELLFQGHSRLVVAAAIGVAVAVFLLGTIRVHRWKAALPATLMLMLGAASCVLLQYHIAAIVLLFGTIIWLRAETGKNSRLVILGAALGLMAMTQLYLLHGTGVWPGRTIIGAFVGTPSIWPTLRFSSFSPVGVAMLGVTLGLAAYRLAQGRKVPVHFLFFAMAVWAPLVAIGFFAWDAAIRYTMGPLPFFLLGVLAGVTYLIEDTGLGRWLLQRPTAAAAAGVALVAMMVNPTAAWQTAKNSFSDYPDQKGAAEFIKSLKPGRADILIAEDSISQTYYLGKVDYRLQSLAVAVKHSMMKNGVLYGHYTGTPVIASGRDFEAILDRGDAGNIYVIGSQFAEGMLRRNRANGIAEVLESDRLEVIYVGRDHETKVWKRRRQEVPAAS